MKIQCDVCEKAPATVICCADEAALCAQCDMEVHAANKLASKHQRLLLSSLSTKLPPCDICQDKPAFIFCLEDRALFCQDCDESVHPAGSLSANHQRLLATGIRVALSSDCKRDSQKRALEPPNQSPEQQVPVKVPPQPQEASTFASQWSVDDLLHFPDFDKSKEQLEFGELDWLEADMGLFNYQLPQDALAIAEVPQLPPALPHSSSYTSYKPSMPYKKARIETIDDDDEFFTVPDLG